MPSATGRVEVLPFRDYDYCPKANIIIKAFWATIKSIKSIYWMNFQRTITSLCTLQQIEKIIWNFLFHLFECKKYLKLRCHIVNNSTKVILSLMEISYETWRNRESLKDIETTLLARQSPRKHDWDEWPSKAIRS